MPLSEGLLHQPIGNPDARLLAATQLSTVSQQSAGHGRPNCQSTCQSTGRGLHSFVRMFLGSFIQRHPKCFLRKCGCRPYKKLHSTCQGQDDVQPMETLCTWSQEDEVWAQRLMA
ncbi:uncharacterized protein [Symphalangus syndactylus]|uniref:uncharacterized protein n=1 Tax=Symphalangus syndactylus TaxID=9590 RepID=UPI0030068475